VCLSETTSAFVEVKLLPKPKLFIFSFLVIYELACVNDRSHPPLKYSFCNL
jgi:hypothetical protein